jgi:CO/xanthine dehydrogenase Mo-binding subunit
MSIAAVLPGSLNTNRRLAQWLAIHADGTVSVRTGKVELGQGITTALAQIAAQELGVAPSRIRMVAASTSAGPNEGMTAGSMSVAHSGAALRQVCAEARDIYLQAAASKLGLASTLIPTLDVMDGRIFVKGDSSHSHTSYWELADDALLDVEASGQSLPLSASAVSVADVQRLDIPDKVIGKPRFIHDMALPGMLYGRVAHPPSPGAVLLDVDMAAVQALPDVVSVVRDGSFLGVVAEGEYQAVCALNKLMAVARWRETDALPAMHDMPAFLRAQPLETHVVAEKISDEPPAQAARSFQASYSRPYLAHASIGPSCAVARFEPDSLEVWTHSQGIYNLRADLALIFDLPQEAITLQHVEGAGCYGHNGADDVACDAALLARAVPGRAVQLQWTREDELSCAPFGAAMAVDIKADVGADGRITRWQHDVWSNGHSMRPGRSKVPVLLAATLLEPPFEKQIAINVPLSNGGGAERNTVPLYDFADWRAVCHRTLTMPIRTSSLRSLGAHCNVFAIESFLDEIASSLEVDPLEFRLRHLSDPRGRAVLEAAAQMSGWGPRKNIEAVEGKGMGLAFARYKNTGAYCAVVAAIDAGQEVTVDKLWIAVDVGRVVSLDGVVNQIEGGAIQTVSWVLKEAVQFDRTRIVSNTWDSYPILRFSEVPKVEVQVVSRLEEKSLGAGEATHGPVAAAIANAVFDALGVRVRDMPLSKDNMTRAALADAN